MNIRLIVALALGAMTITLSAVAHSQSLTGQHLLAKLESDAAEQMHATMFVGQVLFEWEGKSHCKPPEATLGQAVALTKNFLKANPHLWHHEAAHLVAAALQLAWPCRHHKKSQ
jgi:Rap1a immunity proteins